MALKSMDLTTRMMGLSLSALMVGCIESQELSTSSGVARESLDKQSSEVDQLLNDVLTKLRDQETLLRFDDDRVSQPGDADLSAWVAHPLFSASLISVPVRLLYPRSFEMKVSANGLCEGGVWQPYQNDLSLDLDQANQKNLFSVVVRDPDLLTSNCETFSVTHDSIGPEVNFQKYPMTSVERLSQSEIVFDIFDQTGAKDLECLYNGIQLPSEQCLPDRTITLPVADSIGTHRFVVRATDGLGNSSEHQVVWTVTERLVPYKLALDVAGPRNQVDLLLVIDNSGSMAFEQQSMAQRMGTFLNNLAGLNWRAAVTTTDPRAQAVGGDGKLLAISGTSDRYFLSSEDDPQFAQAALGATLQRRETGYHLEQGILASFRLFERARSSGSAPSPESQFLRMDSDSFQVVLISDEDESSNGFKNDPSNLVQHIYDSSQGRQSFSFHSIITRPGDQQCLGGNGASYGHRYKTISDLTGGLVGSVCEFDYASQLTGIGQSIRASQRSVNLACSPVARPLVSRNGVPFVADFSVSGTRVEFAQDLPAGRYEFDYQCLEN